MGTYIARRSRHNTGSAVDITLVRFRDGKRLRMGGFAFGPSSHTYNASGRILRNRLTLKNAMERFGFSAYLNEWWHFEHYIRPNRYLDVTLGCWPSPTRDNGGMAERTDLLRVALAQLNPTVGDIRGNARKISEGIARARDEGASLVVFPELALTGYPPEDLLLKTSFLDAADAALQELAGQTQGIAAVVGYPEKAEDVYNSAAVLADGDVVATYRKMYLPNYGVFDEQRYFQSGAEAAIVELNGVPIGLSICEDIWEPGPAGDDRGARGRAGDPEPLRLARIARGVGAGRERMLIQRAVDNLTAVVFVNTVGGQDELVFDGHSLAIDQDGQMLARAPQFEEALTLCTIDPRAITAARLRDTRHRANVRRQRRAATRRRAAGVHACEHSDRAAGRRRGGVRRAGRRR